MDDSSLRRKQSLHPSLSHGGGSIRLLLTNLFFNFALHYGRHLLQAHSVHFVLSRLLFCGALLAVVWSIFVGRPSNVTALKPWTLCLSAFMFYTRNASLLYALSRLPPSRIALILFHSSWLNRSVTRSKSKPYVFILAVTFVIVVLLDATLSGGGTWSVIPAYAALVVEAVSSGIIDHTNGLLVPTLGNAYTVLISAVGAWPLSLLASFLSSDSSDTEDTLSLSIVSLLALACLFLTPLDSQSVLRLTKPNANVPFPYLGGVLVMSLLSPVFYGEGLSVLDAVFPFWVLVALLIRNYDQDGSYFTPIVSTARRYLEAILAKPESRKIFYFLLLNMCYMLVQMLYGLWTNSLGLISDAIHMAFDCMAIGIGLVASVMAQWKPNERFTYGYTRIETLSGFSNGIFLILISVFIVFEAVQRLMTPPEMNTSQLLLVSSIGLAVNLFGMFAMGGHHHHGGHSHSHGHGSSVAHTHSHSHTHTIGAVKQITESMSEPQIGLQGDEAIVIRESASYPISTKPQNLVDHLRISDQHLDSPVTPSYTFDYDEHLEHHHGPSQGHQDTHIHEGHSHNMRGVFLHVMADTLGSVGVMLSTILIQFYGWTGFDPIASLFIAILIAASVIPLVIDTGRVLLLDLSSHHLQIQHATEEVSHISGLSSFTSQFWLKDDNAVMGSVQLELSRVQSMSQNDTGNSQLIVEKVQNIFMDHVSQLQQLNIQIGVYES